MTHTRREIRPTHRLRRSLFLSASLAGLLGFLPALQAQSPGAPRQSPNLESNIERPLRYHPEGTDFVITDSPESFNRPLYGTGTAFRVDTGDRPQYALYLPGRGGLLRIGWRSAEGSKWADEAEHVTARYRPGSLIHEIRDAQLGDAVLVLTALPHATTEGLLVQVEVKGAKTPLELIWGFGGANGQRGNRDVDIGTEREPVNTWWRLQVEHCKDNQIQVGPAQFSLRGKRGTIAGAANAETLYAVADANAWRSPAGLLASVDPKTTVPVLVARTLLAPAAQPLVISLQRVPQKSDDNGELATYLEVRKDAPDAKTQSASLPGPYAPAELAGLFTSAEGKRASEIAGKLIVDTPDAFLNAAAGALNEAADGVWDQPSGTVQHGAVAWRSKLLGWRGPYLNDALGWHDRALSHINYWSGRQNTSPIPDKLPPADEEANLSRSEAALHNNGDLSNSHYDMNLVFIDMVFRHLLWTGDRELAAKLWPVIERHLAWEQRLFRRSYGPDKLPLYEGYCCIWASDDVAYHGGGATHSSAYNYYHNKMAARLARLLGKDATPYEKEAELILKGMRRELWLADRGWYAEWKDLLGLGQVHPSAALWTFYHSIDSELTTPFEAWQMTRFVDTQLAKFPLRGPGMPAGDFYTLPTTNWMPYTWSTNNVVMSEVAHTALAYWQSQRPDEAWKIFKGAMLDSMFAGLCPGNAGMCTQFDVARREAQRDFADSVGMMSRALVEGLFGVAPDALAGELRLSPGFPADWDRAELKHSSLHFRFTRKGLEDCYVAEPKFGSAQSLRLHLVATHEEIASVTVNGKPATWNLLADSVGAPRLEICAPAAERFEVRVTWKGAALDQNSVAGTRLSLASGSSTEVDFAPARVKGFTDPQAALSPSLAGPAKLALKAIGTPGARSAFVQLSRGAMSWWQPVLVDIKPGLELEAGAESPELLSLILRNNAGAAVNARLQVEGTEASALTLAAGSTQSLHLSARGLLPGTQRVTLLSPEGALLEGSVTNWLIPKAPAGTRFETVDLGEFYNDKVTRIFKNEYLTPRSPFCSLAIPKQGIGSWCRTKATAEIDDRGLRARSAEAGGRLVLPNGIPFATPSIEGSKNIVFTSQWDNFPREVKIPLNGKGRHLYLLMAGSTNSMQSRFDNGEVVVTYSDGSTERLVLRNPDNWWPIEEDFFIDDYAFRRPGALPPRVDLKSGAVRISAFEAFKGKGHKVSGGAATVLDLPLRSDKELKSLCIRTLANEVVIGLLSATVVR